MATSLALKRMAKERQELEKANSDYFAYFTDDNLLEFEAYILGPDDTLYQHKLVKLRFKIPEKYPMEPPDVTFVQHSGYRIHPNLYVEGKVCLSILGTWEGEPWVFGMNCNSVLITIRSLLDNSPYKHEPDCDDHPEYNRFVEYSTWRSLLLDYVQKETVGPAKEFLQKHLRERGPRMMDELRRQKAANSKVRRFYSPYHHSDTEEMDPDYRSLIKDLGAAIAAAQEPVAGIKRPLEQLTATQDDADHDQRQKRARTEDSIDMEEVVDACEAEVNEAMKGVEG